tara:strand:+ start:167 stop:439 length:273 start_codon:yes stop_codon:yes gene_type:complete
MTENDLKLLAEDFFESHLESFQEDDKCMIQVARNMCDFYLDPSHQNKLNPQTLRLIMGLLKYMDKKMCKLSKGDPQSPLDSTSPPKPKAI